MVGVQGFVLGFIEEKELKSQVSEIVFWASCIGYMTIRFNRSPKKSLIRIMLILGTSGRLGV